MRKRRYIPIAAALTLAACSDAGLEPTRGTQPLPGTQPETTTVAVGFDTYMSRSGTTRGGAYGAIDTPRLMEPGYGFGVFAYQTGSTPYGDYRTQDAAAGRYPDFMYNEPIGWDAAQGKWVYMNPGAEKKWPAGVAEVLGQTTDGGDRQGGNVSFFAYAPYTAAQGKAEGAAITGQPVSSDDDGGILAFSTANFNGGRPDAAETAARHRYSDPYVSYKIAADANRQVDLLWATTQATVETIPPPPTPLGTPSDQFPDYRNDGTAVSNDYTAATLATLPRPAYNVPADLTEQKTDGTVHLHFKHALARLGGTYIGDGDGADEDLSTPTNGLMAVLDIPHEGNLQGGLLYPYAGDSQLANTPYNTKVTINEVTLESSRQLTAEGLRALAEGNAVGPDDDRYTEPLGNSGTLNLATGVWSDIATRPYRDGTAGHSQTVAPATGDATADSAATALLDARVAEPSSFVSDPYTRQRFEELPIGVTTVPKNVCATERAPFLFIPGTHPVVAITLDYTVRCYDAKLANRYSEARHRTTRHLFILDEIRLNKRYNILMHIALSDVSFSATVSDWDVDDTAAPQGVYLPINVAVQ